MMIGPKLLLVAAELGGGSLAGGDAPVDVARPDGGGVAAGPVQPTDRRPPGLHGGQSAKLSHPCKGSDGTPRRGDSRRPKGSAWHAGVGEQEAM